MGKGRKNRKPQPAAVSATMPLAAKTTTSLSSAPVPAPLVRRIGLQFAALLGLSAALGFTFNAANPIGVRFAKATSASGPFTGSLTNFSLTSTASVAVTAPQSIPQPTPQPTPQTVGQPVPPTTPPPQLPAVATQVHTPTTAASSLSPLSNPPPTVTVTPAPTNPVPIHWREAKPLVAAGQALLLDVRPAPVYDAGHIPDAVSLPEASSAEMINAFLEKVPTNLTLIVYCSSTSCSQSKRVADRLVGTHKWGSVKYMTGGYLEYQQEELARGQPQQ